MEPAGSLPHSQVPATCPYPKPDQSSPCPQIPLPKYIYIYISVLRCPTPRLHCFLSSHGPSFRFLSFMALYPLSNFSSVFLVLSFVSVSTSVHFLNIHFNSILPPTPASPMWFFPSGFSTKTLYILLLSPMRATCPAHLSISPGPRFL